MLNRGTHALVLRTILRLLKTPADERATCRPRIPLGELGQLGHAASEIVTLLDQRSHVETEVELHGHATPGGVCAPEVERLRHVGEIKETVDDDDGPAVPVVHGHRLLPEVPGTTGVL